jgi:hypothetical protein
MMSKPRKHKFVTECLKAGETVMRVWPSKNESLDKYMQSVEKIQNDPRILTVEESTDQENGFVFTINPDA